MEDKPPFDLPPLKGADEMANRERFDVSKSDHLNYPRPDLVTVTNDAQAPYWQGAKPTLLGHEDRDGNFHPAKEEQRAPMDTSTYDGLMAACRQVPEHEGLFRGVDIGIIDLEVRDEALPGMAAARMVRNFYESKITSGELMVVNAVSGDVDMLENETDGSRCWAMRCCNFIVGASDERISMLQFMLYCPGCGQPIHRIP